MRDNAPANDSSHEGRCALGRCPRCGATVIETTERYACEKSLAEIGPCPFRLGKIVLAQPLDHRQVHLLLTTGRTELLHQFVSKSGRTFSAYLTIDDTAKVVFDFPPSTAEITSEPARQAPPEEPPPDKPCTVLLEAATQDLFRQNAFRITGLPVDASPREIAKHADRLKIMEELGQGASAHTAAFALSPPPTVDQIRDAIRKLKDPELRIIDEFFWFWPKQFDQARSDPALQAIRSGSAEIAKQIWSADENQPADGAVAAHNLAIAYHIAALDRAQLMLESTVITNQSILESLGDWRSALNRWERLLLDDRFWDHVAARIRDLDDDRLTSTRFDRRMRATLPEALDKINATLALRYAERGITDLARTHANLLREPAQVARDVEKTIDLVLAPVKDRLREHVRQARSASDNTPDTSDRAARALLEATRPLLQTIGLFYPTGNPTRDDLFDEVATACMTCAIAHQRNSHDNDTFVSLLQQALPLAASAELKQRIHSNIAIGKGNLARKTLEPIYETLSQIEKLKEPPHAKFARFRNEIEPRITACVEQQNERFEQDSVDDSCEADRDALGDLQNSIAIVLRGISIDLYNDHGDIATAIHAITLAVAYAGEKELKARVAADWSQLNEIRNRQEANNLHLKIRSDEIEITRDKFRYNNDTLSAKQINAVRFGIYIHTINGIRTAYYLVGARDDNHREINVDCKRVFRSEDQADADWRAIVNSLYQQIVPGLCTRLAQRILSGTEVPIGDARLSSQGMHIPTGALFWKETPLVPYPELGFSTHQGSLYACSTKNRKISKSFSLREVWNAVILEDLIKTITKLRS